MSLGSVLITIYVAVNLMSFMVMAHDKRLFRQRGDIDRISEGLLFFMATASGALGVYLGMFIFKHKTRKWYFKIGVPLLILQNSATIYLIWEIIDK